MNYWQNEVMGESHRQHLMDEAEQYRLERVAIRSRVYHPGLFERTMFSFANWMIATGKQLRERYEVPAQCANCPSGSFAQ